MKDQGVDTKTAVVHITRDRSRSHHDSIEDDGGTIRLPSGPFLRLSKYWHIKSPAVTLVPIATVVMRYGLIKLRQPIQKK